MQGRSRGGEWQGQAGTAQQFNNSTGQYVCMRHGTGQRGGASDGVPSPREEVGVSPQPVGEPLVPVI